MIHWHEPQQYHQDSAEGYSVAKLNGAEGAVYLAFGPTDEPGLSYWKWAEQHLQRTTYAIGQPIPQRTPLLGSSLDAAGARVICERDRLRQHYEAGVVEKILREESRVLTVRAGNIEEAHKALRLKEDMELLGRVR